jgi:hypothetical protein
MSNDIKAMLENLTEEQKAKLLENLIGLMPNKEPVSTSEVVAKPLQTPKPPQPQQRTQRRAVVNKDFKVERSASTSERQRQPVKAKPNTWADSGEERDPDFNPDKFEKLGRAQRNRAKPNKVEVECHVCGKEFSISPNAKYGEFYRCNRCV